MIDIALSNKYFNGIVVNNDLEFVLQQIDLLFNTEPNDVLGDTSFGTNYDKYLYTLGMSNFALEQKIMRDIQSLDLRGFIPNVTVTISEGTQKDIAFIDIVLNNKNVEFTKSYIINN